MQAFLGFLMFASMIGVVMGLLMCISPARRSNGKTIALGSAACFGAMVVVLGARAPVAPQAVAIASSSQPAAAPKPENMSRSQILANFRIRALSWQKEGFGTVMVASFTVHNDNPMPVKDVEITCSSSGPSGSTIDKNTRTVYDVIRERSFLEVTKLNMGFIRSEADGTKCRVTGFSRV